MSRPITCGLALALFACSPAAPPPDTASDDALALRPLRLTIDGRTLRGPDGKVVRLHGANLRDNLNGKDPEDPDHTNCIIDCNVPENHCSQQSIPIVTEDEAAGLADPDKLSFNFVRLRISFEGINRDDCDPDGTNLSPAARQAIDAAVARLASRRVWILLEMRTSDTVANSAGFYDVAHPNADFLAYQRAWRYLAARYAKVDYIAGYGLLAEPSPDKVVANTEVVSTLVAFQRALMDTIHAVDPRTPFFLGPAFNYDTLGYRWDDYATAFPAYRGRLIYEVNVLMPKPWIGDGTTPDGAPMSYPAPLEVTGDELTAALLDTPVPGLSRPLDDEKIFTKNRVLPETFPKMMTPTFPGWYLETAAAFADRWQVPMIVDQFGANIHSEGQLTYEADVIEAAEAAGMGWSRWLYNAYQGDQQDQDIEHNPLVRQFYAARGQARPGP